LHFTKPETEKAAGPQLFNDITLLHSLSFDFTLLVFTLGFLVIFFFDRTGGLSIRKRPCGPQIFHVFGILHDTPPLTSFHAPLVPLSSDCFSR
jgi:hypothetical protein